MDFESLQKLMRDSGIVGCGGAGFPSYAKLNKNADTLVINCAECEPLLRLHRQLIEKRANEIMQTAEEIARTIGAKQVIIGIKAAYENAVNALNANIEKFPFSTTYTFRAIQVKLVVKNQVCRHNNVKCAKILTYQQIRRCPQWN